MDGYILHPPAQDLATAGYSSAAKGGLAGVLVMLLLAIVFYVFFKCRNCSMKFEVDVEMQERSVHAAAVYGKEQDMGIAALEAMLMDMMDSTMEALEAMLMDDEFREIHSSENGLDTSFKISISPQVRSDQSEFWAFE
ncbi:hypothetical protein D5086_022942 [Populus alba]|uniref:Uncharacterized protein n=1 Tax=Populus alba TaxID=43335 RepID=A0ACC4B923_POPAL